MDNRNERESIFSAWIKPLIIAVLIGYILLTFVFERAVVSGDSMDSTLAHGQSLFEYKLDYYFNDPQHGDIIVFEYEEGNFNKYVPLPDPTQVNHVKRIIGVPGDVVDINDDGEVFVNGEKLNEPYLNDGEGSTEKDILNKYPLTLGEDEYFVMGDNRYESLDSRHNGPIKRSQIRGKVVAIIFPFSDFEIV